ncbi:MAG: hypothetical protein ACYC26_04725 [Phycisphaerales bacterium]
MELLVVVSIIALLIALLLPSLSKARQSAISLQCAAKLHGIGMYYTLYATDYNGYLPAYKDTLHYSGVATWHWYRLRAYWPFPSNAEAVGTQAFVCPSTATEWDVPPSKIYFSYSLAHSYLWHPDENQPWGGTLHDAGPAENPYSARPQRLTFFSRPAETAMIFDSAQPIPGFNTAGSFYNAYKFWIGTGTFPAYVDVSIPPNQPESVYGKGTFPHLNTTNILHYDGHVKAMSLQELRADSWMGYWGG